MSFYPVHKKTKKRELRAKQIKQNANSLQGHRAYINRHGVRLSELGRQTEGRVAIAAEHKGSASLGLDVSTLQGTAIIDCVNEGEGTIYLSLPESWKRREVRNARLEDVTLVETGLGFTRWTLPVGATLSMTVPEAPRHVTLHHPSPGLLKVRLSRIDLEDDAVTRDTILVQGKEVEIW